MLDFLKKYFNSKMEKGLLLLCLILFIAAVTEFAIILSVQGQVITVSEKENTETKQREEVKLIPKKPIKIETEAKITYRSPAKPTADSGSENNNNEIISQKNNQKENLPANDFNIFDYDFTASTDTIINKDTIHVSYINVRRKFLIEIQQAPDTVRTVYIDKIITKEITKKAEPAFLEKYGQIVFYVGLGYAAGKLL